MIVLELEPFVAGDRIPHARCKICGPGCRIEGVAVQGSRPYSALDNKACETGSSTYPLYLVPVKSPYPITGRAVSEHRIAILARADQKQAIWSGRAKKPRALVPVYRRHVCIVCLKFNSTMGLECPGQTIGF